jgi:hypothetical protein
MIRLQPEILFEAHKAVTQLEEWIDKKGLPGIWQIEVQCDTSPKSFQVMVMEKSVSGLARWSICLEFMGCGIPTPWKYHHSLGSTSRGFWEHPGDALEAALIAWATPREPFMRAALHVLDTSPESVEEKSK